MKNRRGIWLPVFLLYALGMLVLLFHRDLPEDPLPFWQQAREQLNLVPFRTIRLYLRLLDHSRPVLRKLAVINLAGNVAMFLPLGGLLPLAVPRLGRWWKTLGVSALAIAAVEALQLATLRGACDIDDLILNLLGAALGYGLFRLCSKKA